MPVSTERYQLRREVIRIINDRGGNPRVHPNGFIQLDLEPVPESWHASHQRGHSGASRRLHIWNPPDLVLPHQGTVNEVHDHVFDMESTVIRGVLCQRLYRFVVGLSLKTHELYRAIYAKNSDSRLEPTGIYGELDLYREFTIPTGKSYTQPAFTLHDSFAGTETVVTLMTKKQIHVGDATVVCPIATPPDNSYDRASAAPADVLYDAIERSLR